jgi:hypothetical protein
VSNNWKQIRSFLFGVLTLLAGCSPVPGPEQTPERPAVLIAAISPAVQHIEPALQSCASLQPHLVLFIDIIPFREANLENADLFFRLGAPTALTGFSAPIIDEEIAIITHVNNPIAHLAESELRRLFEGEINSWAELGGEDLNVEVWTYDQENEIRTIFEAAVWEEPPVISRAYLAPGPDEMLKAVSEEPSAVGYLPLSWLHDTVHAVSLTEETLKLLRQPVLALAPKSLSGEGRALLGCLQSGPGQQQLREIYRK